MAFIRMSKIHKYTPLFSCRAASDPPYANLGGGSRTPLSPNFFTCATWVDLFSMVGFVRTFSKQIGGGQAVLGPFQGWSVLSCSPIGQLGGGGQQNRGQFCFLWFLEQLPMVFTWNNPQNTRGFVKGCCFRILLPFHRPQTWKKNVQNESAGSGLTAKIR